jgi:integrase
LKELLPAVPKSVKRKKHFASLHYAELPELVSNLRQGSSIAARALEFLILTAARTGETRFMEWSEIDFNTKVWTIDASRMKMEREHRVPLSSRAIEILKGQKGLHSRWVFPGAWLDRPMSNMTMLTLLRTFKTGVTVHGMRSSFRTWCGERTNYPRLVCEAALAHRNNDEVEDAYLATDYLERRVELMEAWLGFIEEVPVKANVTPIFAAV